MDARAHLITKTTVNTGTFIYLRKEITAYSFIISDRTMSAYSVASAATEAEMLRCHCRYVRSIWLCHNASLHTIP